MLLCRAYVALGSSLGDRVATLREGARRLGQHGQVTDVSRLYDTMPIGGATQPFVNAAMCLATQLSPRDLLDRMLEVEASLGRRRDGPTHDRTLDLDLVAVREPDGRGLQIDEPGLRVPHPRAAGRDFVLAPIADLDPHLALPDGRTVAAALAALDVSLRTIVRTRLEQLI